MKLLSSLVLVSITLWATEMNGQGIKEIEFTFHHSLRIPFNKVEIKAVTHEGKSFIMVKVNPLNNDPKWRNTKVDTTYMLTSEEFKKLEAMVRSIQTADVTNAMIGMGEDGTLWKLSFGDFQNRISFQVWTPESQTRRRRLGNFVDVCRYMMSLAKLDYKKIID